MGRNDLDFRYDYNENFKGRDSLRAHNKDGQRKAEEEYKKRYERNPTRDELRDFHRKWTKGHKVSLDFIFDD